MLPNYNVRTVVCPDYLDPEKLIVHYTTFSIKSWMPVSSTDHLLCGLP
ncbi:MAG: hypothetical protein ACR5LA_09360 [Wolbachia sp.]